MCAGGAATHPETRAAHIEGPAHPEKNPGDAATPLVSFNSLKSSKVKPANSEFQQMTAECFVLSDWCFVK